MNRICFALLLLAAGQVTAQVRIITFNEAIAIALEANSALKQAQNTAALNDVAVSEARSQFLPDLRLSTTGADNYGRNFNETEGRIIEQTTRSLSLNASSGVTLFDGLRNVASLRGAKFNREVGRLELDRARETVVFTVAADFFALVQQQEQLNVRRENLAAEVALEQAIEIYVEGGSRVTADLYAQQAAVANARVAVVEAQRSAELAKVGLMKTLALDPLGQYEFEAAKNNQVDAQLGALSDLLVRALANRPDIDAGQARLDATKQTVRAARGSRWPTLSVGASYGTAYTDASPLNMNDQFDLRRGGFIGVNLSFPLFDRNNSRNAIRRAELQANNAQIAYEDLEQTVGLQVRSAYLEYQSAREQLTAAELQQRATQRALEAADARFRMGATTLIELSQARARHVEAESALIRARLSLQLLRTQLDYQVGDLEVLLPQDIELR